MRILDSLARSPARRIGGLSLALVWAMAWIGLGHHLDARAEKDKQPRAAAAVVAAERNAVTTDLSQGSAVQTPVYRTKKIQDIRVGDRVMAHNPELSDEDRRFLDVIDPEPEPETWRKVTLRMTCASSSGDTDHLDIELLRPLNWIESFGAAPGRTIELDMWEIDAVGSAEIISIESCPVIESGIGRVVTGTFGHTSATVLDLHLSGLSEPIGVTGRHRFWCEDKRAFVPAEELREGQWLRGISGQSICVSSLKKRPGLHRVYNMEVHGEHVYNVAQVGVLVHNTYQNSWHRGTFPDEASSIKYHLAKHGRGRTAAQYTNDALNFFNNNKHLGTNVILKDGTPGIRIKTPYGGGYWTLPGNIVTFWD